MTMSVEERIIKLQAGVFGVLLTVSSLIVLACSVAAFVIQNETEMYNYPLYGSGFILAIVGCVPWGFFSGTTYLVLSCQNHVRKRSNIHKRMLEFQIRWPFFFMLVLIAVLVVIGTALRLSVTVDPRTKGLAITALVGSALTLAMTTMWPFYINKHQGTIGIKAEPPDSDVLLVSFKIHGAILLVVGLHQVIMASVAFAVNAFDVTDKAIRIAAFVVGGFLNSLLAFLSAFVCFRIVRLVTKRKTDWREKTEAMMKTHVSMTWAYVSLCIAGVALFGNCFKTISQTNESGEWDASVYVVLNYISSLLGNVLLGYLYGVMAVMENPSNFFQIYDKGTPSPPEPSGSNSGSATANSPRTTAQSRTATTTVSTSRLQTTTSSTATRSSAVASVSSTSGNTATTSACNGASGSNCNVTDIDEIKEKNRLLREQILLEEQLKEIRQQQVTGPDDSVLYHHRFGEFDSVPIYVREAPNITPPPSYDDVTQGQGRNT